MLPLSEGLLDLPSDLVPFWAIVESVLFCTLLFVTSLTLTFFRPTDVEEFLLHPPSIQNQISGHSSMLFQPVFFRFLAQQSQSRLLSNALLQFFILVLLLSTSSSRLSHHLHIFRATASHVHLYVPFKKAKVCQCGHLIPKSPVSHMTAPAGPLTCLQV